MRHTLSFLDTPADLEAFSLTSKGMRAVAMDTHLVASALLKQTEGGKAFMVAASQMKGRSDVMLRLLDLGVSATERAAVLNCFNPLEMAACFNHPAVVKVLLGRNDVRGDVMSAAFALFLAARHYHKDCVQLLLSPSSPVHSGSNGWPLLHTAALVSVEAVQKVLMEGVAVDVLGPDERSVLHWVCAGGCAHDKEQVKIMNFLLRAPRGRSLLDQPDCAGNTPLHFASFHGLQDCVYNLLFNFRSQARNMRNHNGQTPHQLTIVHEKEQLRSLHDHMVKMGNRNAKVQMALQLESKRLYWLRLMTKPKP